ncbi:hypothetical protein [Gordonia sihwensis]|uniref:hypothetical protein n=1 Tax=Gordonia sihwensis TaxID=173559 RepID=UPI0005EEE528|nr:hypothetical protein [Gordonia sihwensis]KJR10430.1 hypothetical protein UG54_00025 [Gordonia sihwensis]
MSVIATAPRVGDAVEYLGNRTRRGIDATNWKTAASMIFAAAILKAMWAKAGIGVAVVWLVLVLLAAAVLIGRRRFPQTAGVVAASTASAVAVVAAGFLAIAATGLPTVSWPVLLSVPMLVIVTAAVFVAPHRGVHTGWSVALAQGTVLTALPVGVWAPTSDWTALVAIGTFILAIGGVYFRSRHAEPTVGRWRRRWQKIGMGMVAFFAALTVLFGAPGAASGIWGIGDLYESVKNEMLCSFTRPDLTQQGVGTGPESMLPSRNFGQVKGFSNVNETPSYSDQIGQFDRLGANQSMDNYTLYEIAGLRGIKFVNWQKNDSGEEQCSIMPWLSVTSGNMVMALNSYVLQGIITLKEISQSGRPFEFLYDKTIPLVDTLFNGLFIPAAALMFVLLGISVLARVFSGGNGFREALGNVYGTSAAVMIGAMLFSGLTVANWSKPDSSGFFLLGSLLDSATSGVNSAVAEASFRALNLDGSSSLCKEPRPVPAASGQDDAYVAAAPGQRYSSCILAEGLLYRPWALGQFGSAGNDQISPAEKTTRFGDPRIGGKSNLVTSKPDAKGQGLPCYNNYLGCSDMRSYLIAQEGGPSFDAARKSCMQDEGDYTHLAQCDPYHAVANQLTLLEKSNKPTVANAAGSISRSYHGEGLFPHLTQSIVALIATLIVGAGVGVISVMSLWWQFMLLVLFITGVPRLMYAAFPGRASALKEYGADFTSTFIQRVGYGLLSLAMIAGVALIFGAAMAMGLKILFTALLMFGMMRSFKKIQDAMKVKGSTIEGPASTATRGMGLVGGLAAYKGAGLAVRTAGATARGAGRAGVWSVRKPKPDTATAAASAAVGGSAAGAGAGATIGGAAARATTPRYSPIRRAATGVVHGINKADEKMASGAAAVGRGARVVGAPVRRPAAFAADWAAGKAHQGAQRGRGVGRRVDRALGAKLPASKVDAEAARTATEFGKRKVANGKEHIESAVSYLTPRAYADYLSPGFKQRADQRRDAAMSKGKTYRPRSFSEWEKGRDFENRLYKAHRIERRGGEQ